MIKINAKNRITGEDWGIQRMALQRSHSRWEVKTKTHLSEICAKYWVISKHQLDVDVTISYRRFWWKFSANRPSCLMLGRCMLQRVHSINGESLCQWVQPNFDPPPRTNSIPLTDYQKICHRWLCQWLRPNTKFGANPSRGKFLSE